MKVAFLESHRQNTKMVIQPTIFSVQWHKRQIIILHNSSVLIFQINEFQLEMSTNCKSSNTVYTKLDKLYQARVVITSVIISVILIRKLGVQKQKTPRFR